MAKRKYIETPEALLELFESYVKETKTKPFIVKDWVGGTGKQVLREKERPITLEGFRVYSFKVVGCVKQYFDNPDNRYDEYITICSHIKDMIRSEQIDGGMAGIYNPSITQRLNGLTEKTENTNLNNNISILNIDPIDKPMD
jgi:cellulase/cellobiase CelA1